MSGYEEDDIIALEGLEGIRRRPGMYLGDTGEMGFHHLLWEIVDNSVDEAMGGHANAIRITLHKNGRGATVQDNGRGIPHGMHKSGKNTLDVVFTLIHAGGKFKAGAYKQAGGLHGVGATAVNACSSSFTVTSTRDGNAVTRQFRQGHPVGDLTTVPIPKKVHGTTVAFNVDTEIFPQHLTFDWDKVRDAVETKAYLNPTCEFELYDERTGDSVKLQHAGGLLDLLRDRMPEGVQQLSEPFSFSKSSKDVRLEMAMVWTDAPRENCVSFANGIPTIEGGTHVQGVRNAVGTLVKTLVDERARLPKKTVVSREDIFEGVFLVIAAYVAEPQFQGQTKEKLTNPSVAADVAKLLREAVATWLAADRARSDLIVQRVLQSIRAREAARSATDEVRRKDPLSSGIRLPGKLADCASRNTEETELFLVEGDSAGGSAKQGRDRHFQAILPLRGKILNTEGATVARLLENREIRDIVEALGCGVGPSLDVKRMRYGRIILLMDADTDGAHITTLALTLFFRHMRPLIEHGLVYLAQPPLYKVSFGKKDHWVHTDEERDALLRRGKGGTVTRFKGLGEMNPAELAHTTMNPASRTIKLVQIESYVAAEAMMVDLMGPDPSTRLALIQNAEGFNLDI